MNIGENTSSASVEKSVFSPILEDATFNAETQTNNRRNYLDVNNSDENKFWQQWDFSNCVASANEDNLKVLSLLDFAGQSAYYACHHIFFSPRAFYILVVDMSKDLNSQADKACDKEGLFYSNWTYAGMQIEQSTIYMSYMPENKLTMRILTLCICTLLTVNRYSIRFREFVINQKFQKQNECSYLVFF